MNLVIDIGNTRVKLAVFEEDKLKNLVVSDVENLLKETEKIVAIFPIQRGILSSVRLISSDVMKKITQIVPILELSAKTKVPFINLYKTSNTLGVDRIALIAFAVKKFVNKNILVIDAGTCITFDFVNQKKEYLGGAISPGIQMRYNSLHHFTSKLPLVKFEFSKNIIGKSTEECINSGVLHGVILEIEGVIRHYQNIYGNLTVVLTGGDTIFLSKQLKSSIFATQNFLLEGLNEILNFNKEE